MIFQTTRKQFKVLECGYKLLREKVCGSEVNKRHSCYCHWSFDIMDTITPDVVEGVDIWLGGLNDEKYKKLNILCERIQQTVLKMKYEGHLTPQSQYTSTLWTEIFKFLTGNLIATRGEITWKILHLREFGEISMDLAYHMIIKLLM